MNGAHVRSRVEEENRKGNENATIQSQVAVVKIVKETKKKQRIATLLIVSVSLFSRIVFSYQFN